MPGNANSGRPRYAYPTAIGERVFARITSMAEYHRARSAAYTHARNAGQVLRVKRLSNWIAIRREA